MAFNRDKLSYDQTREILMFLKSHGLGLGVFHLGKSIFWYIADGWEL